MPRPTTKPGISEGRDTGLVRIPAKMDTNRMKKSWIFFATMAVTFLPVNGPAAADNAPTPAVSHSLDEPVVALTHDQARNFETALQTLADKGHVAFVAEDRPLHLTLKAKDVEALPTTAAPLTQTVDAVAACYDYDVQRDGMVFRLTKRYSDPKDLPAVTLQECLQSLEDVQHITSRFNPDVPEERYGAPDPLIGDLAASLTPEQITALHNRTLLVSTLTPEQQAQVWRMAGYFYVQLPLRDMPDVLPQLREAARADSQLEFRWDSAGTQRSFGYDTPSSVEGNFVPLPIALSGTSSHDTPSSVEGRSRFHRLCSAPAGRQEAGAPYEGGKELSIADAVVQLNLRRLPSTPYAVDAAMRTKPVTIIGASNVKPEDIWHSLAAVYGLHIVTKDDGRQVLTRFSVDVAPSISELPKAIQRAMPISFLHALHADTLDDLDSRYEKQVNRLYQIAVQTASAEASGAGDGKGQPKQDQIAEDKAISQELRSVVEQKHKINRQVAYMFSGMYDTAVERLRLHLTAKLDAAKDQKVTLSKLDEADKRAFAVALTINFLQAVSPLFRQKAPGYVARFDQLYLTGGEETDSRGGKHLGIFLSLPTPDGRVFQQVGVGVPLNNPR